MMHKGVNIMENTQQTNKSKRIISIVLNVLYYIVIVFLLSFSIVTILSRGEGKIPNVFGRGYLAVQTDSMEGTEKDSFKVGDLIFVRLLNDKSREKLEVGDVVTYFDSSIRSLNTHRIVEIIDTSVGKSIITQGDKAGAPRDSARPIEDILAVYTGKSSGTGRFILFLNTKLGFGMLIVLPVLLLFIYQGFKVYQLLKVEKPEALDIEKERERIRQELLEEMKQTEESKETTE